MARQSGMSERMRDPKYKSRNRKKFGSIYGYGPKLSFGGGKSPSGGGGGGTPATQTVSPSIDQILARDPFYQMTRGRSMAEGIATQAERDAAARRAIIDFGYVPPGSPDWMKGVLDPTTLSLANKNTASGMSIWARLQDAAKIQSRDVVNSIGARGMFNSGETGYGLGRAQLSADQGRYDATKSILDYLAGVQSAFAQSERERLDREEEARQKAIENSDGSVGMVGPGLMAGGKPIIPPFNTGAPPTGGAELKGKSPKTKPKLKYATPTSPGKPVTKYKGGK